MSRKVEGFRELNPNIRTKIKVMEIDRNPDGVGVVPAAVITSVTPIEKGDGVIRQTVLNLSNLPVTMRDTEQGGGVQIYTFPKGRITLLGATAKIAVTTRSVLADTLNASKTCNWGVGTVTQSNATVTTTEQNIVNVGAFTSSATINVASAAAAASGIGIVASLDGTSTPIAAFLNLAVAGADDIDANASVTVDGVVTISYVVLGGA
jgi:hypothetical protein